MLIVFLFALNSVWGEQESEAQPNWGNSKEMEEGRKVGGGTDRGVKDERMEEWGVED